MNPPPLGNASLDRFDVLIIGSGPSGASVARLLCQHGQKVVMLEAGPNYFAGLDNPAPGWPVTQLSSDELKLGPRSILYPDGTLHPRTTRASEGDPVSVGDLNHLPQTVGGGSVHADMKLPRFRPKDFRMATLLGAVPGAAFADWPITYDQLERFYTFAEQAVGVQGQAGADPLDPPRSAPYPMPPGPTKYGAQRLVDGALRLGYRPFPIPTGVNSRPYDGRPACTGCGFCGAYGCPINAKGSAAVTSLRKALLTGRCQLWSQARAVRLLLSGSRRQITGVEAVMADGSRQVFRADRYVLSLNAIEDARLLLLSDPGGPGVGNSSGLLGRHLMFHTYMSAIGIFDERLHDHRGRGSTHGLTDFRGDPEDRTRPMGGIVEIGGSGEPIREALTYLDSLQVKPGARLKAMMRQGVGRDRAVYMSMFGEDAPQTQNRVDLDPQVRDFLGNPVARLTYQAHDFELAALRYYAPKLIDIMGAAGARYAAIAPLPSIPGTLHLMGTLRFGTDPKASVCDATGRLHDLDNLYAADGSLCPTSSGFNSTLTAMALSYRVAAEMISPGSPERALDT